MSRDKRINQKLCLIMLMKLCAKLFGSFFLLGCELRIFYVSVMNFRWAVVNSPENWSLEFHAKFHNQLDSIFPRKTRMPTSIAYWKSVNIENNLFGFCFSTHRIDCVYRLILLLLLSSMLYNSSLSTTCVQLVKLLEFSHAQLLS